MGRNDAVLVIVDPSARHHAGLAKGALLARMFQTHVDLFACSDASRGDLPGDSARAVDESMRVATTSEILQMLARPLRDRGLDVTTEARHAESPNAALTEHLKNSSARFVIKDIHPDAASGRAALTRSDWQLARACPVSLLLSKSRLWPALPKICAAIDNGDRREHALLERVILEQGAALTSRLGGELDVLHACADVLTRVVGQLATSIVVMGALSHNPVFNQLACDVLLVKSPQVAPSPH